MSNIPTSTQPNLSSGWIDINDQPVEFRQFVIFASSMAVDLNGKPLQEIPLDIVEENSDEMARMMVYASETYTADDGWIIEYRDAQGVSFGDMMRLTERLAEHWDEYIGVSCQLCADSHVVETCGDVDGVCITMQGDCPHCGTA